MTKILSSPEPDPLQNQRLRKNESKSASEKAARHQKEAGRETTAEDMAAAQNRLLLRSERALRGLQAAGELLAQGAAPEEKQARLEALLEQTRFQDEPVLNEYAGALRGLFQKRDRAGLEKLVADARNALERAARDRVIRENVTAAAAVIPEDVLKDVVQSLKTEGPPRVTITRQRVLDLLRY